MNNKIKKELKDLLPKSVNELYFYKQAGQRKASKGSFFIEFVRYDCSYNSSKQKTGYVGVCCHACGHVGSDKRMDLIWKPYRGVGIKCAPCCPKCGNLIKEEIEDPYYYSYSDYSEAYIECIPENGIFNMIFGKFEFWTGKLECKFVELTAEQFLDAESRMDDNLSGREKFWFLKTMPLIYAELAKMAPYSGLKEFEQHITAMDSRENERKLRRVQKYMAYYKKYPHLEQLVKAGYFGPVDCLVDEGRHREAIEFKFNKCFKPGKSIKEIVQFPEAYSKLIKNENVDKIDEMRIMVKKFSPSLDAFRTMLDSNFTSNDVKMIKQIMSYGFYDLDGLMNHLERCNLYQAIWPSEALLLTRDYHSMCKDVGANPDLKTGSLKRDHDIMVRNHQCKVSEIENQKFQARIPFFKTLEYSNNKFMVVAPTDPADIINEGRAMNNCVGSYVGRIVNGTETIMFIRKVAAPTKSYVTISIDDSAFEVLQAVDKCNRNKQFNDPDVGPFIYEWIAYLKAQAKNEKQKSNKKLVAATA